EMDARPCHRARRRSAQDRRSGLERRAPPRLPARVIARYAARASPTKAAMRNPGTLFHKRERAPRQDASSPHQKPEHYGGAVAKACALYRVLSRDAPVRLRAERI